MRKEDGIRLFAADIDHIAHDFLFLPFSIGTERHFYVSLCDVHCIGAGIENQGLASTDFIGDRRVGNAVIVSAKEDVDVRNLFCYLESCVIQHAPSGVVLTHTAVHHHHNDVGFGCTAYDGNNTASCFYAIAKIQIFPESFGKPLRNGGRDHAEYADAHSVHFLLYVGREVEFVLTFVYDIGTQYCETAIVHPAIVDGMSGFHVVVAQCTTKVAHFIEHACTKVGGSGVYVIIIVGCGLTLQNIPVVDE